MTSPKHARRCDWPRERCRSERWRPVNPDHPTCYWGWPPALWSSSLYCCTPPSSLASRCLPSEDLSACCCLYSDNTCSIIYTHYYRSRCFLQWSSSLHHLRFQVLFHHHHQFIMLINVLYMNVCMKLTSRVCPTDRMKSKKGSSPALCAGEFSWIWQINIKDMTHLKVSAHFFIHPYEDGFTTVTTV